MLVRTGAGFGRGVKGRIATLFNNEGHDMSQHEMAKDPEALETPGISAEDVESIADEQEESLRVRTSIRAGAWQWPLHWRGFTAPGAAPAAPPSGS